MTRIRRFLSAIGRHWIRLTIGALLGLCVTTVLLVDLLIALESERVTYDFADTYASSALALLMFGCVGGALYTYARRQPQGGSDAALGLPARDRLLVRVAASGERTVGQGRVEAQPDPRVRQVQAAPGPDGVQGEQLVTPGAVGRTTGDDGLDAAMDVVARARLQAANDAA